MVEELKEAGLLTPEWTALRARSSRTSRWRARPARPPLALDHARKTGAAKPGDLVMLLAIETSKWKYAGDVLDRTAT